MFRTHFVTPHDAQVCYLTAGKKSYCQFCDLHRQAVPNPTLCSAQLVNSVHQTREKPTHPKAILWMCIMRTIFCLHYFECLQLRSAPDPGACGEVGSSLEVESFGAPLCKTLHTRKLRQNIGLFALLTTKS